MTEQAEPDYSPYLRVAEQAAREAGALLLAAYGSVSAREKGPGDLITEADRASQRRIAEILLGEFPGHTLLAEEDDVVADPGNPWRWVVDPLDGTINFAHGFAPWGVSIGLEHAGRPVVGVIQIPLSGETYAARLGGGATLNDRPIRASPVADLRHALIATELPTAFEADADRQVALFRRFATGTHSIRRPGSTAWSLAQVARGACEVCYATAVHPWDVAAGVVLIGEAGGRVSDLAGGPHDPYRPVILATNGRLHDQALAAIAESWPGR